ncbi:TPA: hypothetical protein ACHK9A_004452, partial [Escherichia coli]
TDNNSYSQNKKYNNLLFCVKNCNKRPKKMQNIFLYKICFIISLFSVPAPLCFGSQQGAQ